MASLGEKKGRKQGHKKEGREERERKERREGVKQRYRNRGHVLPDGPKPGQNP